MTTERKRLPAHVRRQIVNELGTMTDTDLADKYSKVVGWEIGRHTIFYLRKSRKIPSFHNRGYTKPSFRGRLEDAYPEVADLIGKIPLIRIAEKYNVSRSCVRAAAKRLGIEETRATDFEYAFEALAGDGVK